MDEEDEAGFRKRQHEKSSTHPLIEVGKPKIILALTRALVRELG